MASTKDLYDELKGNPLVNIKDDYDTFNAKLKDANFLKRLDEVMSSLGKDINAYDIPKKKMARTNYLSLQSSHQRLQRKPKRLVLASLRPMEVLDLIEN